MDDIRQVEDEDGRLYKLEKKIKSGGQGAVYTIMGGRLAVKLIHDRGSTNDSDRLRQQLDFVRRLPLDDLTVARPLKMLHAPRIGYVMEMLSDMEPIDSLTSPPQGDADVFGWYIKTGGLRRRLRLLARCARVLSQLHGKALVYSDLSPRNVLISCDTAHYETWLVDVDNLRYQSTPAPSNIHTPGYGAPEIVTGKAGVNSLSDAFSLAVIAFEVLTLVHPFVGDWVHEGEPELENRAFRGELPYVDAPYDESNRALRGIPRENVLSPRLRELVQRTFVDGLHEPLLRPKPSEWAERLGVAADVTIECPACSSTYYFKTTTCPWCDTPRPPCIGLRVHAFMPEIDSQESDAIASLIFAVPAQINLPNRIVSDCQDSLAEQPVVEITVDSKQQIGVRLLAEDRIFYMASEKGGRREKVTHQRRTYPIKWRLHLGDPERRHRIISFNMLGSAS